MTKSEILEKAIKQAISNGWGLFGFNRSGFTWNTLEMEYDYQTWLYISDGRQGVYPGKFSVNDIVFNQDFAKAFWGIEAKKIKNGEEMEPFDFSKPDCRLMAWEYYIQRIALEQDRVKYLEQFLH